MKIFLMLIVFSLFGGCASNMYYFGNYSETLYAYKKEPNEKTRKAHSDELKKIIYESKEKNSRVPPGIYSEYAYLLYQQGQKDEALQLIQLEEQTYPESHTFTARLKTVMVSQAKGPVDTLNNSISKDNK